jgi:hypothetical protein
MIRRGSQNSETLCVLCGNTGEIVGRMEEDEGRGRTTHERCVLALGPDFGAVLNIPFQIDLVRGVAIIVSCRTGAGG